MRDVHLIHVPVNLSAMLRWARERGWLAEGAPIRDFDDGHATHCLVDEALGRRSLRPFRLMVAPGGALANLYGYSEHG